MKVKIVKEVMACDVSPVAMFQSALLKKGWISVIQGQPCVCVQIALFESKNDKMHYAVLRRRALTTVHDSVIPCKKPEYNSMIV